MYRWKSSEQYEGPWIYDKMNGKGNFSLSDGKSFEAVFVNDAKAAP